MRCAHARLPRRLAGTLETVTGRAISETTAARTDSPGPVVPGDDPLAAGIGSRLDGTVSTHLVRLLLRAAREAGVAESELARVPGTGELVLRGELNRIPMRSLIRLWELIAQTRPGAGSGAAIAAEASLGTLDTWDYLVTTGPTLADSLRAAQPYHRLVTAAAEGFDLSGEGELTIGYRTSADDPAVTSVVNEYVLAYYLRRAREATGRPLAPTRVRFGHRAPVDRSGLVTVFGTDDIEFDALGRTELRSRRTSPSSTARCPHSPMGRSWCATPGCRSTRTCAAAWTTRSPTSLRSNSVRHWTVRPSAR